MVLLFILVVVYLLLSILIYLFPFLTAISILSNIHSRSITLSPQNDAMDCTDYKDESVLWTGATPINPPWNPPEDAPVFPVQPPENTLARSDNRTIVDGKVVVTPFNLSSGYCTPPPSLPPLQRHLDIRAASNRTRTFQRSQDDPVRALNFNPVAH